MPVGLYQLLIKVLTNLTHTIAFHESNDAKRISTHVDGKTTMVPVKVL